MAALVPLFVAFGAACAVSAALALAAAVVAWRGWMAVAAVCAAAGAGAGYACGHMLLSGWPGLPRADTTHWLAFLAPAAVVLWAAGRVVPLRLQQWWGTAIVGAVAGAGVAALLFLSLVRHSWTPGQAALQLGVAGASMGFLLGLFVRLGRRTSDVAVFATTLTALTCASACLVVSGSMLLGQLAGIMCLALAPVAVVALFMRTTSVSSGCAAVAVVIYWGLLLLGHHYANLPAVAAVLLVLAPLGGMAAQWLPRGSLLPRGPVLQAIARGAVAAAAVAVPGVIAVALSVRSSVPLEY